MTQVRLQKQQSKSSYITRIESWVLHHANILMPLCLIILIILFVGLCYALVGVSATESGTVYNQFDKVV